MKIQRKPITNQKFRIVIQIYQPTNIPKKVGQYLKRTFGCQASNETDPKNVGFTLFTKLGHYLGEIFFNTLQDFVMFFCLIFKKNPKKNS